MRIPGFDWSNPAPDVPSQLTLSRRTWLKALAAGGVTAVLGQHSFAASALPASHLPGIVDRAGGVSPFKVGDKVAVSMRYPIGHYRTPFYLRGKQGLVVRVVDQHVNPEEEAFGRNAGDPLWVYQVRFSQADLWPDYAGASDDHLQIEIFENWLEKA